MNWLEIARVSSAIVTGILGILGTIIETKHKTTRRITAGGWVVLGLILVAMILGVTAQLAETSHEEREKAAAMMQTLALAKKTDQTLTELHRVLTPLDDVRIGLLFDVKCGGNVSDVICRALQKMSERQYDVIERDSYGDVTVEVHIFKKQDRADQFINEINTATDSHFGDFDFVTSVAGASNAKDPGGKSYGILSQHIDLEPPYLLSVNAGVEDWMNKDGAIVSVQDIHGCTLVLVIDPDHANILIPKRFTLDTKSGEQIMTTHFEKVTNADIVFYRGIIP